MEKLISLNICGLIDPIKQQQLLQYVLQNNIDIVMLQETNLTAVNIQDFKFKMQHYTTYINPGVHRGAGVFTAFSKNFPSKVIHHIVYVGYVSVFTYTLEHKKYCIVNAYIPNNQDLAKDVIETTQTFLSNFSNEIIVVGGDFNCTLQPVLDRTSGLESHLVASRCLNELITQFDLIDTFRHKNPNLSCYSKYTKTKTKLHASRLDRFYLSSHVLCKVNDTIYMPVSFSDHFVVQLTLNFFTNKTAYWIFSNHLLKNQRFNSEMRNLWINWRTRIPDFPSLANWWELGKAHIKMLVIQNFSNPKYPSGNLTKEFMKIANLLPNHPELHSYFLILKSKLETQQKKFSIESIAQQTVKTFQTGNNPSGAFFKSIVERKPVTEIEYIKDANGTLLCGMELEKFLRNFYHLQYSDNLRLSNDITYLEQIPKLSDEDNLYMSEEYVIEEIITSVKSLSRNTAPGLDGLTSEFYQHFRDLLMPDLLRVFVLTCNTPENFPLSWTTQVIKLIPKPGDSTDINNWRAISLCCNDYKIIAKLAANRLKSKIGTIVNFEQSYCIPNRTIYDNINTAKFMFDYHELMDTPLAMISIDQRKAFDNVSHDYLIKTLQNFNIPIAFINIIKKLYSNSSVVLKHRGKLLSRVPFSKGIRQGCPLSGMLYSLVIETFLFNLRKNLNNLRVTLPFTNVKISSLAYADDLLIIINNDTAFDVIAHSLQKYEDVSGTTINFNKSKGMWCGSWKNRQDTPLTITWTSQAIKYLGINIGPQSNDLNDQSLITKITKSLSAWKEKLRVVSLRSRVIILNYLVASSVYHILKSYTPHFSILKVLNDKILSAFWYGRRWIAEPIIYQPMVKGGLGLSNITLKAYSFQLKNFQHIFTNSDTSFSQLFQPILILHHPKSKFNYFYTKPKPPFPDCWPDSIKSMVLKWAKYRDCFNFDPSIISYNVLENIPIWNNPDIKDSATGAMLNIPLFVYTCGTLGDVVDSEGNSKIPVVDVSSRMLSSVASDVYNRLSNNSIKTSRDALVVEKKPTISFEDCTTQIFYEMALSEIPVIFHYKVKWKDKIQGPLETFSPNIKMLYNKPTLTVDADIAFKLIHHSLPHPNQTSHFAPNNSRLCNVCKGDDGSLFHRFFECAALQYLKVLTNTLITTVTPTYTITNFNFLFGPKSKTRDNSLISFILNCSKAVIHQFFCNTQIIHTDLTESSRTLERLLVCKIKKRIHIEFLACNEESFNSTWGSLAQSHNKVLNYSF